jgi:hypothetical protein
MTINSTDQTHPEDFRLLGEITNSPDQHRFLKAQTKTHYPSATSTLPTYYTLRLNKRDVDRMVNIPSHVSPNPKL